MPDSLLIPAPAVKTTRVGLATRLILPVSLLAAMLCNTGCLFQKKQVRVFHPPPPAPRPAPAPLKLPPNLEPPASPLEEEAPFDIAELIPATFDFPAPPPPPPVVRPRNIPGPKPAAVPPTPPDAPAPKLVQILPQQQQRGINRELDDILERDQKALESLARKNPSVEQLDRMAQIRELLTQARQAREQDLVTAILLARRADTFAKDLLERLP